MSDINNNNTKLELIVNFILQNNNNEFSIQAFLKKIILEGIDFTDDNVVYLAERFGDKIDVETFAFMGEVYREVKDNNISLNKGNIDEELDEIIESILSNRNSGYELNGIIPKTIAIKHYIRNKKVNEIVDGNPLYKRVITINDNVLMEKLPKEIELSKQTDDFYFIHRNKKRHGSFFIIHKGKYVYIDSTCNKYIPPKDNEMLKNAFLGSQNISIQSDGSSCRTFTGLGMIILDEYIKKYGIENLEELSRGIEFSDKELEKLNKIKNTKPTKDELKNELKILNSTDYSNISKISSLQNIKSKLNNKKQFLVMLYLIDKITKNIQTIFTEENKEKLPQLQQLEKILIENIKTIIINMTSKENNIDKKELQQLQQLERELMNNIKTSIQDTFKKEKGEDKKELLHIQLQQLEIKIMNNIETIEQNDTIDKRILQLEQSKQDIINNLKITLQNTINQEKQENKENTSITEQSLLKLLQLIDPTKESIDIDKDFEDIILLFNRVDLRTNKVFSLTHLLFPLAQTMSLVNTYIDHNEQLKNADNRIKDIKDKVKVNHFVNDFREDIKLRFDKIEELFERIDEQKLQDMKFFETPIEELLINEEIKETEEIEQEGKITKEIPYPDFVSQNNNEYIVALLEAVMGSGEMFERYTNSIYFKQKFAYV